MESRTGKLTLQDVAQRAGVSMTASSLALRDRPGVSAATRERILRAAREIGYRVPARPAAAPAPITIGVLLRDIVSVFSHDVVSGMEPVVGEEGMRLMFFDGRGDRDHLRAQFEEMTARKLQGIITFGTSIPAPALQKVAQRIPVVMVGKVEQSVPGVDVVSNDDALGADLAVRHVVELGHRRIAHLAKGTLRAPGYRQAMADAELERFAQVEGGTMETLRPAIRYLLFSILQEESAPTAVFAETDGVAIDFLGAAVDAGLRIPPRTSACSDTTAPVSAR